MSTERGVLHQGFARAFQRAVDAAFRGAPLQTENVHLWGFLFCLFFFFSPLEHGKFLWKMKLLFITKANTLKSSDVTFLFG